MNVQDPDQVGAVSGKQVSFRETVEHAMAACPVHHTRDTQDRVTHPGYVERFRTLYAKLTESSHEDEEAAAQDAEADLEDVKPSDHSDHDTNIVTPTATPAPVVTLVTDSGDRVRPAEYSADSLDRRDRRVSLGATPASLPRDRDAGIKHGSSLTNLKVSHPLISASLFISYCRVWPSPSTGPRSARVRTRC